MDLSQKSVPRIGILGGTFDPVHSAHLALGRLFVERLALDSLVFLPTGNPWQKDHRPAAAQHRLAMLSLAMEESQLTASIDEREIRRTGASYTVDSLVGLRREFGPRAPLVLLMGADQLSRLHTWSRWKTLLELADVAVAGRPSFTLESAGLDPEVAHEVSKRRVENGRLPAALDAACGQMVMLPADLGETSSSGIRNHIAAGDFDAVRDLVPSRVLEYIRSHGLYAP